LQAEKDTNKLMATITEADEMIKSFDEKKGRDV
jgi:hypothetical protein